MADRMNKELKPCVNDMCYNYNEKSISHYFDTYGGECNLSWCEKKCSKYITEKPESAYKKMWAKLKNELTDYIPCGDGYRDKHIIINGMMNRIENELKNE